MPAKKTESQHLQDVQEWILNNNQNDWEVIGYCDVRNRVHFINMRHNICGLIQPKRKNIERIFNCSNPECIRKKTEYTCLERYGAKTSLLNKGVQEKIKKTNLERYGVENIFSLPEVRGGDKAWTDKAREKREATFLSRYGVKKVSDIHKVREKIREAQSEVFAPREEWQILAVSSSDRLIDYLKALESKPTRKELSSLLGIHYSATNKYIRRYEVEQFIETALSTSAAEKEIGEYIKSLGFEIEMNNRSLLKTGQEIDIYIPSLKIGFEYNGLYWHSSIHKEKTYHRQKMIAGRKQGIQIYQIFADEWELKKDIMKAKIGAILRIKSKPIYARKCEIKPCASKERNQFLENYHLQGADRANFSYGLYYSEELVGIMTFVKPRKALGGLPESGVFELSRFATSQRVTGGFAKMLAHFLKHETPREIYTYADLRWTDPSSNVYSKNNFLLVGESEPNYFYLTDKDRLAPGFQLRVNRYNFAKHRCLQRFPEYKELNFTEREIMEEEGYSRIYDCGTLKYSLIVNKQ